MLSIRRRCSVRAFRLCHGETDQKNRGVQAALAASMSVVWVPDAGLKEHMEKTEGVQVKPTQELKSLEEFKPEDWGLPAY